MALKSTIFRAELQVSDVDRGYYGGHSLTLARHPSENDERMMVRLLAFALNAHDALAFGDSIGSDEEPSLWRKDPTGVVLVWIDVGQPDDKRIRRACGRAARVIVFAYGGHGVDVWLNQIGGSLERSKNLSVINLPAGVPAALAKLAQRSMKLQFTIQAGHVWVTDDRETVHLDLTEATVMNRRS
jgi:uncharacterized protein YaeQ